MNNSTPSRDGLKRSSKIKLLLLGGISAGALTACAPGGDGRAEPRITPENVYTNDYFISGVGYYHAPFHAFYPQRYNYFDPQRRQYFYGGQWGDVPYRSVINVSSPTAAAAQSAESILGAIAPIQRGGFGSTSHGIHIWS